MNYDMATTNPAFNAQTEAGAVPPAPQMSWDELQRSLDDAWMYRDDRGVMAGLAKVYRAFVPLTNATQADEQQAEEFFDPVEDVTLLMGDGEHPIVEDGTALIMEPTPNGDESHEAEAGCPEPKFEWKLRVRRAHGRKFVGKWVAWGKAEFPGAYRSTSMADRMCIEQRLCKEMRKEAVWDRDIVKYKSRIMIGILLPSREEVEEERIWATTAAGDRKRAGQPAGRSWWGWLSGRTGVTWRK